MNDSSMKASLARLSATEFAQIAPLNPVILLALGSQEDHGPHLPMGDYLVADALALRIAGEATRRGVPSFAAPTLPYGVADFFGCSAGGLAISAAGFQAVLQDVLQGLLGHGLTRIVLLNGHGGNVPVIQNVTLRILRAGGPVIPSFYLWKAAGELMERSGVAPARFGHGAEPLLSLTAAIFPDRLAAGETADGASAEFLGLPVSGFGTVTFNGVTVEVPTEFDRVPRAAIAAAWPQASASLGERIADELVDHASGFVAHFAKVASNSGVSKSRNTESVSTGTSETNSM